MRPCEMVLVGDALGRFGINGWRLPTLAELNVIYSASETASDLFEADGGTVLTNARKYFYTDAEGDLLYRVLSSHQIRLH